MSARFRTVFKKTAHAINGLFAARRGAVLPMIAVSIIPSVGAIGMGVDLCRIYMAQSQLQAAVDSAALAGGRAFAIDDDSAGDRDKQVESYFYENFPAGYLGTTSLSLQPLGAEPRFQQVNGLYVTTVTASASLPMTFMSLLNVAPRAIKAVARAELQPRPLEVMVVLDDTGSMRNSLGTGTRMTALKTAAKSFVDILYQGGTTRTDLAMGFVMYDVTVNVGKLLTDWKPSSVVSLAGFNDSATVSKYGSWPTNKLGWKGCVMNDTTIQDVSSDLTVSDVGAWDIVRTLPGEGAHPAVQPYFIPPMYVPTLKASAVKSNPAEKANPLSQYYKAVAIDSSHEPWNNLYKIGSTTDPTQAVYFANSDAYRKYFFDYYIGLNDKTTSSLDDVITAMDGSFLDPATVNRNGVYLVNYTRIPYASGQLPKDAATYIINYDGGKTNDFNANQTAMPSPNWQCPQPAVAPAYNRSKSFYNNIIDNENGAIYPANGTMHHSGLLWGYRLLVRDDAFPRSNPTNSTPKRALVFMTDGNNEIAETQNEYTDRTFTWYGRWSDKSISATENNQEKQSVTRFAKTCAAIAREVNPPKVYIITLALNNDTAGKDQLAVFEKCAPGRVYQSSDASSLNAAFKAVATELVDLHLTR